MRIKKRDILKPLKNLIKTSIFTAFLAALSFPNPLFSENFRNEKEKFSLEYPSDFVANGLDLHNVGLALTSKKGQFPTFNVLIESGYIDLNAPKSSNEKAVLDSYRLVGITDASIVSSEERTIDGRKAFIVILSYPLEGHKLNSLVALFSLSDRHYILTFIDEEKAFIESKNIANAIVSSFRIDIREQPLTEGVANEYKTTKWLIYGLIAVVILGIIMTLMRRKRIS